MRRRIRHRAVLWVVGLLVIAGAGCSSAGDGAPPARAGTTLTTPGMSTVPTALPGGATSVVIAGISLRAGQQIAVAFHPAAVPVVLASSADGLEICAVDNDGLASAESPAWPAAPRATGCAALAESKPVGLRATDGVSHVTFAVRAVDDVESTEVTVTYVQADSFFGVLPQPGVLVEMSVRVTPTAQAVLAVPFDFPSYATSAVTSLSVTQADTPVTAATPCDFASELNECLGPVQAGVPVDIRIHQAGNGAPQIVYLAWGIPQ